MQVGKTRRCKNGYKSNLSLGTLILVLCSFSISGQYAKSSWSFLVRTELNYGANIYRSSEFPEFAESFSEYYDGGFAWGAGLEAQYAVKPQWLLGIGLRYQNRSEFGNLENYIFPQQIDPYYGFVSGQSSDPSIIRARKSEQRDHYLEIPVRAQYVFDARSSDWYAAAGLKPALLISRSNHLYSEGAWFPAESSWNKPPDPIFQLFAQSSFGYRWLWGHELKQILELGLSLQTAVIPYDAFASFKVYSWSLGLELSYGFGGP
ncbi:MAG: outer membrane beta-barrel protein [Bacteroidetes bacterium]|nr:outer membrane beta-barrel protein [Bacteroidota bacterium]